MAMTKAAVTLDSRNEQSG